MNTEVSNSALNDVEVIIFRSGKAVNDPTLVHKLQQKVIKALKSGRVKRKTKVKKIKKKRESSTGVKVKKNKINSTQGGKVKKKKLSKCAADLKKMKNDKPLNPKTIPSNKSEYQKKRKYCLTKEDTLQSTKALKTVTPSGPNCIDCNKSNHKENLSMPPSISIIYENISQPGKTKENNERPLIDEIQVLKEENEFKNNEFDDDVILCDIVDKTDINEIKEEFRNSFGEVEAKLPTQLSPTELPSSSGSQTDISNIINSFEETDDIKLMENSELHSLLLKELIKCEIEKQTNLEKQSLENGKKIEKLFLDSDCEILMKFFKLSSSASRLFVRMLGRKKSWHRVRDITYKEISDNLENEFKQLQSENYVDVNIEDECLKVQLKLLSKPEVLNFCKKFKVSLKKNSVAKKEDCIDALIQDIQKQRSVPEMFLAKSSTARLNCLKKEIKETLGMCIKLNNRTLETFHRVLLLNSFAHYKDDEEQRFSKVLLIHFLVKRQKMKYPDYKVCPTVVFETQTDFEEYKRALELQNCCEIAMRNKDLGEFVSVCQKAKEEFQKILNDNEYKNRLLNLQPFLLKFTAGAVYTRILTNFCTTFQRKINKEEVLKIANLLLQQDLFYRRKKGDWYEILSKTLENLKQNDNAAEVIMTALKDPLVSEAQKVALQLRGQLLLNKQNCRIKDIQVRDTLERLCNLSLSEPRRIEIRGLALEGNKSGHKIVYVQEFQDGVAYVSVEERVISHYKSMGYRKGYHSEGSIIQSLYFLLFFDIIYGLSPEGVFQSPYQEAPLDFYSSSFYNNRKEEIDVLLTDMWNWDDEEVEERIRYAYNRNFGSVCLINWNVELTVDEFCEVAKCITMSHLIPIFERFIHNFRAVRAGFPDLTLWNPETKQCIFVEVKSPSDKLSPAQRVWLEFLKNIGLNCEVCSVRNVSSKSY